MVPYFHTDTGYAYMDAEDAMPSLSLTVEGMSCGHCVNRVREAIAAGPGTRVIAVSVGQATLEYDPTVTDPETVAQRLTQAGYPATPAAPAEGGR